MGRKCCVPGCKSGYYSVPEPKPNISFLSFPNDPDLRNKWLLAIGRPDYDARTYSSVCSLHFKDSDFQLVSKGSFFQKNY